MSDVSQGQGWWLASDMRRQLFGREPAGLLVTLMIAAMTARVLASVVSGIVGWIRAPGETFGRELGDGIIAVAGYADGQGLLLLLVALLVIWWRAGLPRESGYLIWLAALFVVTVAGVAAVVVGTVLQSTGIGSQRNTWYHIVGTGGYELAYGAIALAGGYAALALRRARQVDEAAGVSTGVG
jgi:hypothetical protein